MSSGVRADNEVVKKVAKDFLDDQSRYRSEVEESQDFRTHTITILRRWCCKQDCRRAVDTNCPHEGHAVDDECNGNNRLKYYLPQAHIGCQHARRASTAILRLPNTDNAQEAFNKPRAALGLLRRACRPIIIRFVTK